MNVLDSLIVEYIEPQTLAFKLPKDVFRGSSSSGTPSLVPPPLARSPFLCAGIMKRSVLLVTLLSRIHLRYLDLDIVPEVDALKDNVHCICKVDEI